MSERLTSCELASLSASDLSLLLRETSDLDNLWLLSLERQARALRASQ